MTDIFIDPSKDNLIVQVQSQSLHILGFEITAYASDGNTVMEKFTGDTKANNPFQRKLQKKPSDYKGGYIRGTFTVISPDGTDYNYTIVFSILEDAILVAPSITLSAITSGGKDTTIAVFHLN